MVKVKNKTQYVHRDNLVKWFPNFVSRLLPVIQIYKGVEVSVTSSIVSRDDKCVLACTCLVNVICNE